MVAEIPPSRGTKCASAVINRRVNDRIVKFSNKYELFRQKLDEEENEEEVMIDQLVFPLVFEMQ